jgi:hypothetical protein
MRRIFLGKWFLIAFSLMTTNVAFCFNCDYFYENRIDVNFVSEKEKNLIDHADVSYRKAINYSSKLNDLVGFKQDNRINSIYGIIPYYHLLNNLNSVPFACHLHIGLYTGGSFVGAVYG